MKTIDPADPLSHSADLTTGNIERLRELFPQAVTEDAGGKRIDFDVLRELLGGELATSEEKYGLNWHGKRAARRLALTPSTGSLRPAPEDSVDWDTTQNLMIEGDNLEVLKLLQKSYAGKVKMIYIDPPYNTGKDFVYKDDFRDSIGNYQRITGQRDAEGTKLTTNADASGRFHTDWLNMMYPRLILARALLKEDGAIFISIDDAEITNLRELCAGIFGEENFLGVFVRRRRLATGMRDSTISPDHEYVLSFAKDVAKIVLYGFERKESDFPFSDANGRYRSTDLTVGMTKEMRPNQFYKLRHPDTGSEYLPPDTRVWRFEPSTMATHVVKKNIIWPDDSPQSKMSRPRFKTRFESPDGLTKTNPVSTWIDTRVVSLDDGEDTISLSAGLNQEATKEVRELFGDQIFDYPKPLSLVGGLIAVATGQGNTILDFFAGSGTTGHATYRLNALQSASRKFILCQLQEQTGRSDYRTISEITKERLRRSGKNIKLESSLFHGDLGFRVFKLDTTSIRPWDPTLPVTEQRLLGEVDNILPDRTEQDLLYELLLKRGLELTVPIVERAIAGKQVYAVTTGDLIACLAPHIENADVEALAQGIVAWHQELAPPPAADPNAPLEKPAKFDPPLVVFRDTAFADDVAKSNLTEILKQHSLTDVRSL